MLGSVVGSLSVRRVAHVRGGRVRGRLRRLALGALGSDGSQAISAAHSRRGRSICRRVASFALLALGCRAAWERSGSSRQRGRGALVWKREGWVTFHGAKIIFMIILRRAAFRASAGCCSALRIGILAEALRTVRRRFDPAFLLRSWQRRLSRALCGIGGAEIEGSRRAFPFRRWQRRLSRALCGTSGAEIGGSQGVSSRCRLLRDWKSLLDIMDIIYSICHILLLNSSSISILIRLIL